MVDKRRIAVIDDTKPQRILVSRILGKEHEVIEFANGSDFLGDSPEVDIILLDIEMPEISGYEICRELRATDQYETTPVIFISAHDTAPARVAAYEAGGDDFLIKPIVASELAHKVNTLLEQRAALNDLRNSSSSAQQMAFSVMSNMGELGVLIEFMRKMVACSSMEQIADCAIAALQSWGLHGLIQVRDRTQAINVSTDTVSTPLQESLLATMRTMGRIFEMKSRAVVNYDRISILVQNLPTEDQALLGRLRDHLAMLGELADNGIQHLTSRSELRDFGRATRDLQTILQATASREVNNRARIQAQAMEVLESLERSILGMGVTSVQSEYLTSMVHDGVDELNRAFDEAGAIHQDFSEAMQQLQALSDTYAPTTK